MQTDRHLLPEAFLKIVTLQHPGKRVLAGQVDQILGRFLPHPFAVPADEGPLGIQHLEDLLLVGLGVFFNLQAGQRPPRFGHPAGIPDHAGEITDQENDLMAQILEGFQFLKKHGMAQVKVSRRRVKTGLDTQRGPPFGRFSELCLQLRRLNDLHCAAKDQFHLSADGIRLRLRAQWSSVEAIIPGGCGCPSSAISVSIGRKGTARMNPSP